MCSYVLVSAGHEVLLFTSGDPVFIDNPFEASLSSQIDNCLVSRRQISLPNFNARKSTPGVRWYLYQLVIKFLSPFSSKQALFKISKFSGGLTAVSKYQVYSSKKMLPGIWQCTLFNVVSKKFQELRQKTLIFKPEKT